MSETFKILPEQADDSVIAKSKLVAIYSSNDEKFLDSVIGNLSKEDSLLSKKLILTMLGKKKGFFSDKAINVVTDEVFMNGLLNGNVDLQRLKLLLKYEFDTRVDSSFESRARNKYVKFDEFDRTIDQLIENQEKIEKQNNDLNTVISHYNGRLPINNKFLLIRENDPEVYIKRCMDITTESISEIPFDKNYMMIDYIYDYQFIAVMIDQTIYQDNVKIEYLNSIKKFLLSLDIDNIERSFNGSEDILYKTMPSQVRGLLMYIDQLLSNI